MRARSVSSNDSWRLRLLGLVMVIVVTSSLAAGCLGMVEEQEEVPPADALAPAQSGSPTGGAAAQTPVALRVDGKVVTMRQLNHELEVQLEEEPSIGRREACERAVDTMIGQVLVNIDRDRFKGSVTDATMTAASWSQATFVAEIPPDAATEFAQTHGEIPTIDSTFLKMALELVAQEDQSRAGAETPSPEEIAEDMKDDFVGTIHLSSLTYATDAEGDALMVELRSEWDRSVNAMAFGNAFSKRAATQRHLSDVADELQTFVIRMDNSHYPDFVQDAIDLDRRAGAFSRYVRPDGSGVMYFVVDRMETPLATLEASSLNALTLAKQDEAADSYIDELREQAEIEVLVDCTTF